MIFAEIKLSTRGELGWKITSFTEPNATLFEAFKRERPLAITCNKCDIKDTTACAQVIWIEVIRMPNTTRPTNPGSSTHGGNGNQDRQEVHSHQEDYNHDDGKDDNPSSGADDKQEGNDIDTIIIS